jgi:Regulator of chromosome condensation (RCC1) repeat
MQCETISLGLCGWITGDGVVYSWGCGRSNRLGYASPDGSDVMSPRHVQGLPANVASVACGNRHSGCLTRDGVVWLWGMFTLGDGLIGRQSWSTPSRLGCGAAVATKVICTPNSVIVETEGGSVLEWASSGPVVPGDSSTLLPKDRVKDAVVVASRTLHRSPPAPLAVSADTSSSLLFPHERSPIPGAIMSKLSPMLTAGSSSPQMRPGALHTLFSSPPDATVPPLRWDSDSSDNDLEYEHVPVASVSLSLDDFSEAPAAAPRVDVLGNVLSPASGPRPQTSTSIVANSSPMAALSTHASLTAPSEDPALLESFQALSHKLVAVHVRSALSTYALVLTACIT